MRRLALLCLVALLIPASAGSQQREARPETLRGQIVVGSEEEQYLRNAQLAELVSHSPWSLRPLSVEAGKTFRFETNHPWMARYEVAPAGRAAYFAVMPASTSLRFNSAFPYGSNDAAVWAGRGLTLATEAGVLAGWGPFSAAFRPVFFWAQNAKFTLHDPDATGNAAFRDPHNPFLIDRPQRFGNGAYSRADLGQSWVKIKAGPLTAGASTANVAWGPGDQYPFLLGNNAPGFAHVFFGTARPVGLLIGSLHARMIWGRLEQSNLSPVAGSRYFVSPTEPGRLRFASGVIAVFAPRFLPGLELGAGRFFHLPWPEGGIPRGYYTKPLEAFFRFSLPPPSLPALRDSRAGEENQLASVFLRWALPASRTEFYAEYGREDHAGNLEDFLQQPEHSRTYSLGFRTVVRPRAEKFSVVRGELFNAQLPITAYDRPEGAIYEHTLLRQGHTHRGQLLGSSVGVGAGAGSMLALDRYDATGRRSIILRRELQRESGDYHRSGEERPNTQDVTFSLGLERVSFRGRSDIRYGLTVSEELNRNFRKDHFNLNLHLGFTIRPR